MAVLVTPALALAARPRPGTFTGPQATIEVAAGGRSILSALATCGRNHGSVTSAIYFRAPFRVDHSGSFTHRGRARYVHLVGGQYVTRTVTASISGVFGTPTRVTGLITGPGACRSLHFTARYDPHAR